jgi:hypothetical protein
MTLLPPGVKVHLAFGYNVDDAATAITAIQALADAGGWLCWPPPFPLFAGMNSTSYFEANGASRRFFGVSASPIRCSTALAASCLFFARTVRIWSL